jgi:hypothetical protein
VLFGVTPDPVIVAGESAGATCIGGLLGVPVPRGLFARAIRRVAPHPPELRVGERGGPDDVGLGTRRDDLAGGGKDERDDEARGLARVGLRGRKGERATVGGGGHPVRMGGAEVHHTVAAASERPIDREHAGAWRVRMLRRDYYVERMGLGSRLHRARRRPPLVSTGHLLQAVTQAMTTAPSLALSQS